MKIVEESAKTKKSREKLKKKLETIDQKITDQALKKKSLEIHRWIARHAHQRVPLKTKNVCLFDENQNTATLSQKIIQLAEQLKHTKSP